MDETEAPSTFVQSACPSCSAVNPSEAKFCRSCGGSMAAKPSATRRMRATAANPDRAEAQLALREFNRSREMIGHLRLIYWLGAVMMAILLLPGLLGGNNLNDTLEEGESTWLWSLFFGVGLVLMVVGALRVRRRPLLWTVVIACLWTVYAVIIAGLCVYFRVIPAPVDLVTILFVAVFWFAVARAARLERIMREHPEFQVERRRVEAASVADGVVVRAVGKRRREQKSAWVGRLRIAGIAILVGAIGVFVYGKATAPPTLAAAVKSFREAWGSPVPDAVLTAFEKEDRDEVRARLERRGWDRIRPALGDGEIPDDGRTVKLPIAGSAKTVSGELVVAYVYDTGARRWRIRGITLPDLKTPDVESAITAFESAWGTAGIDEIVKLFTPGMQSRRSTLEHLFEARDWLKQRPKLEGSAITSSNSTTLRVSFETENGTVETRWENHYPSWRINSLRPPR
jgi:ribosomal protein L40E